MGMQRVRRQDELQEMWLLLQQIQGGFLQLCPLSQSRVQLGWDPQQQDTQITLVLWCTQDRSE